MKQIRVLLVADNVSSRMGGEAAASYNYFRLLPDRGIDVWLVAHGRARNEMHQMFPDRRDRISFIEDTFLDKFFVSVFGLFPDKLAGQTFGALYHLVTQFRLRRLARSVIRKSEIQLVHQVYPISPRAPSAFYGMTVPVVIGPPLSGGMRYPPGFSQREGKFARMVESFGRWAAGPMNRMVPGKLQASALLVANQQTHDALPAGYGGRVYHSVCEVCVDEVVFDRKPPSRSGRRSVKFAYLGRLVDWKAVDLLLCAFRRAVDEAGEGSITLDILGDGTERSDLEALAYRLALDDQVTFHGWVEPSVAAEKLRQSDVFVLPSLRESGGIVAMEAMALGLPVVVTDWGGPGSNVPAEAGIKVSPASPEEFISGLATAMVRLAQSEDLRRQMGDLARRHIQKGHYFWSEKIKRTIDVYRDVLV